MKLFSLGRRRFLVAIVVALLAAMVVPARSDAQELALDVHAVNRALGVGINLGNALEAPREGDWGLTLEADYFTEIAAAGFSHVRVPIKFSAYADASPPYTIPDGDDPSVPNAANLWERVDWVIGHAEANGLFVIIDLHHYDELHDDVAGHRDRFLAIWSQISTRYADAGPLVLFEVLNEPVGEFGDTPALLNTLLADVVAEIRLTNPTRPILVGPNQANGIGGLPALQLPNDPNLIVSVHFYDPFDFTHQGADWVDPIPPTPQAWDAGVLRVGGTWQDWSWDIETTASASSYIVDWQEQWSAVQFARPDNPFDAATFKMSASGVSQLQVRCVRAGGEEIHLGQLTIGAVRSRYTIDMTLCPADTTRLFLMVSSASFNPLVIRSAEICDDFDQCERLIETEAQAVESRLEQAAAWAESQGRPLNLGEFGVYDGTGATSLAERAEWTDLVRRTARDLDMSVSYWEFGAGFGAYDLDTDDWVEPLRSALLDGDTVPGMSGDVSCSAAMDINDALVIAQYSVGLRTDVPYCPLSEPTSQIHTAAGDLDGNARVDIVDALLIARCVVGIVGPGCPGG